MENAKKLKPQLSEFGLNPKEWIIMPQLLKAGGLKAEVVKTESGQKNCLHKKPTKYLCINKSEPWFQLELESSY